MKNYKENIWKKIAFCCILVSTILFVSSILYIKSIRNTYQQKLSIRNFRSIDEETEINFSNKDPENDKRRSTEENQDKEKFHLMCADEISAKNIQANLRYLTSSEHVAGTKNSHRQMRWLKKKFKSFGLDDVQVFKYNVLLAYPRKSSNITLLDKKGKASETITIGPEKRLDDFEKNYTEEIMAPFMAFSPSGKIEGELVYANNGKDEDFEDLAKLNVSVKNKIVLVRYGQINRGVKILQTEHQGAKGIIMYSDPDIYCPNNVCYPDTWYLPGSSSQMGSIQTTRGDLLTKGYPAKEGMYRSPAKYVHYFPKVPVQTIGYHDAIQLYKSLDGISPPSNRWVGGLNVTYSLTSKDHKMIQLHVDQVRERRDIFDVIGIIRGEVEPDRLVIVGNHRDAWGFGAADPSSGTAVMIEVARVLGWLKKKGWRPRRTILLCSWDAEEYGLFGSTEWTEEHSKLLSHQAVAYLNVDAAVQGADNMEFKSTPGLIDVVFDAARKIKDPKTKENIYDTLVKKERKENKNGNNKKIKEPKTKMFGSGSDYVPFVAELGIPALDLRFVSDTKDADPFMNYPVYHTIHDNIEWLEKFVDPDYRYHTTVTQIWMQIILTLSDTPLLPFDFIQYADEVHESNLEVIKNVNDAGLENAFNFTLLQKSVAELKIAAEKFHEKLKNIDKSDPLALRVANDQMMLFERSFVVSEDVPIESKTRHAFHRDELKEALDDIKKNSTSEFAVHVFNTKLALKIYHIMMATDVLNSPFTNQGVVKI